MSAPAPTRRITWKRPWMYPQQLHSIFHPSRFVGIEAATKTGKTVGCIIWLAEQAALTGGPNKNYWWVAPSFAQADIAFRRMVAWFPPGLIAVNNTAKTVILPNKARIWFKSAEKPDLLYGEDVYAAVMDEATRMREAAWTAMQTTLTSTGGPVRIIGNVKGRKNWAYRFCRQAEAGLPGTHYARMDIWAAVDAGLVERSVVEQAKAMMPAEAFSELYLAIPQEGGANPFGMSHLTACSIARLGNGPARFYGVDVASTTDWTVIVGLNGKRQVCHFDRFQLGWPQTIDRIIETIGSKPTLIDATGVGSAVLPEVQKKRRQAEGFIFSTGSKQDLMEDLAVSIQKHRLGIPGTAVSNRMPVDCRPGILMQELVDFEYEAKVTNGRVSAVLYSAPEGLHDDCVCALALANKLAIGREAVAVAPHGEGVFRPFAV